MKYEAPQLFIYVAVRFRLKCSDAGLLTCEMPRYSLTFSETYVTSPSAERMIKNPSRVCRAIVSGSRPSDFKLSLASLYWNSSIESIETSLSSLMVICSFDWKSGTVTNKDTDHVIAFLLRQQTNNVELKISVSSCCCRPRTNSGDTHHKTFHERHLVAINMKLSQSLLNFPGFGYFTTSCCGE